jgi:hypothetical protein
MANLERNLRVGSKVSDSSTERVKRSNMVWCNNSIVYKFEASELPNQAFARFSQYRLQLLPASSQTTSTDAWQSTSNSMDGSTDNSALPGRPEMDRCLRLRVVRRVVEIAICKFPRLLPPPLATSLKRWTADRFWPLLCTIVYPVSLIPTPCWAGPFFLRHREAQKTVRGLFLVFLSANDETNDLEMLQSMAKHSEHIYIW